MNDMKQMLEWAIHSRDGVAFTDLADLQRLLNDTPFKTIGYDNPISRMRVYLNVADSH